MKDRDMLKQLLAACSGFTEFIGLLDSFDQPICIKDITDPGLHIIMFANRAFLRLSGYTLTEIVGKTATDLERSIWLDMPTDCDKPDSYGKSFNQLHCTGCEKYIMFAKNGTLLHHQLTTETVEYEGRKYYLCVHRDATTQQLVSINETMTGMKREFKDFRTSIDAIFRQFE